jgi:hypothetical protein
VLVEAQVLRDRTSVYLDWRDQWVGHFRDPDTGTSYICPVPCLVVRIQSDAPELDLADVSPTLAALRDALLRGTPLHVPWPQPGGVVMQVDVPRQPRGAHPDQVIVDEPMQEGDQP